MLVEFVAVEANDPVSAGFLRDVQCVIGGAHQPIALCDARMRPRGDPEACRALNRSSVERECMRLDLFPHPLGEGDAGVEYGARKEEHELLAAVPAGPVDLAHFVFENLRELLENRVACLVAIGVVDTLEPVQIAHHDGERLVQSLGVLEHLLDALFEVPSIVEPREAIGL